MDVVRDDPELASELVSILGRELKLAKKQINDLKAEFEVTQRGDLRKVAELERQVAEQQRQISETQAAGFKRAEEMQKKLDEVGLQKRWLHMELDRIAGVKNEEENDITLPPVKVDPEFWTKIKILESEVSKAQQQVEEERNKKRAAIESGAKRAEELQSKLQEFGFQNRWLHGELNNISRVKKEEEDDITLPALKFDPELLTKIETLEGEVAKAQQRVEEERTEKLAAIQVSEGEVAKAQQRIEEERTEKLAAIQKCVILQEQVANLHRERNCLIASKGNDKEASYAVGGKQQAENTTAVNRSNPASDVFEISSDESEEENDVGHGSLQDLQDSALRAVGLENPSSSSLQTIHNPSFNCMRPIECLPPREILSSNPPWSSLQAIRNPGFKRFIDYLPIPERLPPINCLSHICSCPEELTPLLISDSISIIQRYGLFLYFPKRMFWEGRQNTHAVAFGPFEVCNPSGLWIRSIEFSSLHGHILPLFFGTTAVKYVGNYRCHHALEWYPKGVELPEQVSKHVVADLAYKNAGPVGANSGIRSKAQLMEHYSQGDLKADCLILQCVGFDSGLYNQLLARKSLKRTHSSDFQPGPSKRARKAQT